MDPLGLARPTPEAADLLVPLRKERFIWDTASSEDLIVLRADAARIARDMDDPARPPPMFRSGIPWPEASREASSPLHLVVSVGGTKTDFALLHLARDRMLGTDPRSGADLEDPVDIERVKVATEMPTPRHGRDTPDGLAMVSQIVRHIA